MKILLRTVVVIAMLLPISAQANEQESGERKMDNARLETLMKSMKLDVQGDAGQWQFELEGFFAMVITDENADRMRIIVQIPDTEALDAAILLRLMQANFDSALDARYAIANGSLWSTFIHPLSPLGDQEFASGLAQAVTLAATFGGSFSSGALLYQGGDSSGQLEELYRQILERSQNPDVIL
ncbi:MAG: hypothetical protein AB8B48_02980 [Pseudomonadales bacterium]